MTKEAAMTEDEAIRAILIGMEIVQTLKSQGYEILATGEMGSETRRRAAQLRLF